MTKDCVVVLLNWNGWSDTLGCLRSLEAIDQNSMDIVVIDNLSSDDSVQKIREFMCQTPEMNIQLFVNQTNLGFGGGNNVGILHSINANYKFIWLLNTDTLVPVDAIEIMHEIMLNHPKVGILGAVISYPKQPELIQAWGGGNVNLLTGHSWHVINAEMTLRYLMGASMFLRTDAVRQVGMFDEKFFYTWEDVDLSFRFLAAGWTLMVAPVRIEHKEASSTGKFSPKRIYYFSQGLTLFLRKHSPVPWVAIPIAFLLKFGRAILKRRWKVIPSLLQGFRDGLG
jgi:GT2 family glycosyltransferase